MSDAGQPRRRTREHVIAALGVNYVERQILLAGFTAERFVHDYGLDLTLKTYNAAGEVEAGQSKIQVKATDHPSWSADRSWVGVRVGLGHFKSWLMEWDPVLLVLYDAGAERAYWLDVQDYARQNQLDEDTNAETITLRVPTAQSVAPAAARVWRERLERLRNRLA